MYIGVSKNYMNEPIKKEEQKIVKKYSVEEVKDIIFNKSCTSGDLHFLYDQLGKEILPKHLDGTEKDKEEIRDKFQEKITEVMMILETETHIGVMGTFNSDYREMSKELCNQIIKENGCNSSVEKTLTEIIVNSFIRVLDNSYRLNSELNCREITHERNIYIQILSKQVDRANRQYLSALMTLKQLKAPTIEMNIRTNTAFIAQNQQINASDKNNDTK
jgi:hypothetical protein